MAVAVNMQDSTLTIEDMGVTVRTLLAHAASGYALNQKRKWLVLYKGVEIGSFQVRTKNKKPIVAVKPAKLTQKQAVLANMGAWPPLTHKHWVAAQTEPPATLNK